MSLNVNAADDDSLSRKIYSNLMTVLEIKIDFLIPRWQNVAVRFFESIAN